jgi:Cd(II)/Pb(II)-responsive transcriptional regulator
LKIGELAKRSGCSIQAIRYYEKEGLISAPSRTDGNFREYDTPALEKLAFIKNCRALDLSLSEIKQLLKLRNLPGTPCESVNDLIDTHLSIVEARINDLKKLYQELKILRMKCDHTRLIEECGIMGELVPPTD